MSAYGSPPYSGDIQTNITTAAPKRAPEFFYYQYLPVFVMSRRLNGYGKAVQMCGVAFIIIFTGWLFFDLEWWYKTPVLLRVVSMYALKAALCIVAYAFGGYLRATAIHHRSSTIAAIMSSPHMNMEEARDLVTRLDATAPLIP